jgi:hypothetical protein
MPDPLAIGMPLGGLFGGSRRHGPSLGLVRRRLSPLSASSSPRTPQRHRIITEHDVVSVVSGSL